MTRAVVTHLLPYCLTIFKNSSFLVYRMVWQISLKLIIGKFSRFEFSNLGEMRLISGGLQAEPVYPVCLTENSLCSLTNMVSCSYDFIDEISIFVRLSNFQLVTLLGIKHILHWFICRGKVMLGFIRLEVL